MRKHINELKTTLALIMSLVMVFTFCCMTVNAADNVTQRMGPYRLSSGIGHLNYYITDSVLNHSIGQTLVTLIGNAANSWVNTGYGYNPLYMFRTYNFYTSNIDILGLNNLEAIVNKGRIKVSIKKLASPNLLLYTNIKK